MRRVATDRETPQRNKLTFQKRVDLACGIRAQAECERQLPEVRAAQYAESDSE